MLTYFEEALQIEILERVLEKLVPGGIFVAGIHESIPEEVSTTIQYDKIKGIYQKVMP